MEKSQKHCRELHVYECQGPCFPKEEPVVEGFLGTWPEPPYYYFFFDRQSTILMSRWVQNHAGWCLRNAYQLDYDQWQQVASADRRIGSFIVRTGQEFKTGCAEGIPIHINPGVVFGTGVHPSTQGCLLALESLYRSLAIRKVVDLGTGTGVLGIACALLGASKVVAIDCNPLAARVAWKNVQINGLLGVVDLVVAQELGVARGSYDLLLMNIEWPCLKTILSNDDWCDYPYVILSGFLTTQQDELETLLRHPYHVLFQQVIDGWVTIAVSTSQGVAAP